MRLLQKTPEYCLLRDNRKLREIVKFRLNEEGKTNTLNELDIDRRNFQNYITARNTKSINQLDLLRLCDRLGIKITFEVSM